MTRQFLRVIAGCVLMLLLSQQVSAQAPFQSFAGYVQWMQTNHKAPFERDGAVLPPGGAKALVKAPATARGAWAAAAAAAAATGGYHNVQVNQDRNPWPKAEVAAAVDPSTGNWVVMTNDFRRNYDQMFFHVSTNSGQTWTDDAMVGGSDPFTGFIPSTFQSDPGVSFDGSGNGYLSTITGNLFIDFNNGYENVDTEIDVAQSFAGGTYANLIPIPIDVQPCNGTFTGQFTCDATLDKPFVATDSNPSSPHVGTTYVYYTLFCNAPASGVCTDGNATVPAFQSAIVESHSPGPGQPFSAPALVSGALVNTQFSSLVIDSEGTPHIFFDDFTNSPTINMWESTLVGGSWVVSRAPTVSFVFNGLLNMNWVFRDGGAEAPGCGINGTTAYCAFSANQVGSGNPEGTPSVYLATIRTKNGAAASVVRVNNDAFNGSKHHFFAWATATPSGNVYVGWYDDRRDPFNTKVDYFVGKSTDGGKTFPMQQAVNDVSFNPCTGFPGCGFFGDYTQLASAPDGTVHAAWSDTRDAASMQLWSTVVGF
jgi:hypothetical protein